MQMAVMIIYSSLIIQALFRSFLACLPSLSDYSLYWQAWDWRKRKDAKKTSSRC